MKKYIISIFLLFICSAIISCKGQIRNTSQAKTNKIVGGGCEGCELMYVGMPKVILSESSTIGWTDGNQKLILRGKIFQIDGITPAQNVIVYYWHTDEQGLYSSDNQTPEKAGRHGKLRGWVKSDERGNYTIKTSRPAAYPNENIPQHIHLSIKEPNIANEYYADLYFDDDALYLGHKKKYGKADRTGTEILRILLDGKIQIAEHNIVLGLNIPDYPKQINSINDSGLNIGEDQPSFLPYHAFGSDKGTQTCPVCKYGRYHGIIYFVGNSPNWKEIKQWITFLDQESVERKDYLKVYFVYGNELIYNKGSREKELEQLGADLDIRNVALTFVPSFNDNKTEVNLNKINPNVENTFIIYKHRNIINKFINLKPTSENFKIIAHVLNETNNENFKLVEPLYN